MDFEDVQVDTEELSKQVRQEILDSGRYARIEIILQTEEKESQETLPYCVLEFKKTNPITVSKAIACLRMTLKQLEEMRPIEYQMAKTMGVETKVIDLDKEKGE